MKDKAIIFDIDGTIADTAHRAQHARDKNWDKFFAGIEHDEPKTPIVDLLKMYHEAGYKILLLTGRGEEYRRQTVDWLEKQELLSLVTTLYMRPKKDFRHDEVIKEEIYNMMISHNFNIDAVYEDRDRVVEMWRRIGLTCLQVAPGNF